MNNFLNAFNLIFQLDGPANYATDFLGTCYSTSSLTDVCSLFRRNDLHFHVPPSAVSRSDAIKSSFQKEKPKPAAIVALQFTPVQAMYVLSNLQNCFITEHMRYAWESDFTFIDQKFSMND